MKRFVCLMFSVLLAACSTLPQHSNARQELIETDQAWSAAAYQGKDLESVVSVWSEDAVIVPSGEKIISGKAAIREYVAKSFATPGFSIRWDTLDASVSQDGTMGYTTAASTFTFPGDDGKIVTAKARGVAVWKRDATGAWKCVYDAWNHGP